MKNLNSITLVVLAAISLTACGENKQEKQEGMPMQNDTRMEAVEQSGTGNLDDGQEEGNLEFRDENIAAVYEDYLNIKSALVNTNANEAKEAAEDMLSSLEEVEGEEVGNAAKRISESTDINEIRTAFQDLSASVEKMLEGALTSGQIYKQYCPMAFEGAGAAWLSASEEIRNPYYGDKMLKCGRVEDTIQ